MAGRRWVPMYWLAYEPIPDHPEGRVRHAVVVVAPGESVERPLYPDTEYRLSFDAAGDMWRLDRRSHAEGG